MFCKPIRFTDEPRLAIQVLLLWPRLESIHPVSYWKSAVLAMLDIKLEIEREGCSLGNFEMMSTEFVSRGYLSMDNERVTSFSLHYEQ